MKQKEEQENWIPESTAVTREQIETLNLNRILILCVGGLSFELLNVLNPRFGELSNLWIGTAFAAGISLTFIILILWNKKHQQIQRYRLLNAVFWLLFIVAFFPFLANDAAWGDKPLNCAILGIVLICGPLLDTRDLRMVFVLALLVNIAAPFSVGRPMSVYYGEVAVITTAAYLMARNLHGRYFRLLDEQEQQHRILLKAQIEQQNLREKLEKEQDANAAKTRFLSLMSHDLRTPLSAVIGLSEIAADEKLPREEVRRYLGEIHQSGQFLLHIINDVLDMSKLESQKLLLHPEPYSFTEFCESIKSSMRLLCAPKQLRFTITGPERDAAPYLITDKTRFHQIFLNLLTNAVKYTQEGGKIELMIEVFPSSEHEVKACFTVRDTGIGMSPEFLTHAFEPFAQERDDDRHSGTGLGLPIVKNLVELMGGTVHIDSRLGEGTSVLVDMNFEVLRALPPKNPKESPFSLCSLAGKRILLCEDNQINAEIVKMLLRGASARVDHASDGKQGLSLFTASLPGTYDAVLMDIRMPEMNGMDASRAIRALARPDAAAVPIIALTANAYEEDRKRCLQAGMNDHVSKPIDTKHFLHTICVHIQAFAEQKVLGSAAGDAGTHGSDDRSQAADGTSSC